MSEDGFTVETATGLLSVKLPLENNTISKTLIPLATFVNLRCLESRKKADVVAAIKTRITTIPMSEAVKRWPELDVSLEGTSAELSQHITTLRALEPRITQVTPEFGVHVWKRITDLQAAIRTVQAEEAREGEKNKAPPFWVNYATGEQPSDSCFKVTIKEEELDHDGYCSECGDDDDYFVTETSENILFLPADEEWDFESKKTWEDDPSKTHCCCNARTVCTLVSVEKIGDE